MKNFSFTTLWRRIRHHFGLIRTKLIVSLLAVLILPSALIGYFSYDSAKEQVRKQMTNSTLNTMRMAQDNINQYIAPVVNNLEMFSWDFTTDQVTSEATQAKLDHFISSHPELDAIIIGNEAGQYARAPLVDTKDYDPRTRLWYQNSQKALSKVIISEPEKSKFTGNMVVTVSKALVTGGGSMTLNVSLDKLVQSMKDIKIGDKGTLLVLDPKGKVVAGSGQVFSSGSIKMGQDMKSLINMNKTKDKGKKGIQSTLIDMSGYELEVYTATDSLTGWNIVGMIGTGDYSDAARPILVRAALVIAISILIGGVIIFFMVRQFVVSMRNLQQGTKLISGGDLTERVQLNSSNEFGLLANDFNEMANSLHQMVSEVNQTSNKLAFSSQTIHESTEQTAQSVQNVAVTVQQSAEASTAGAAASAETARAVEEMAKGVGSIAESASTIVDSVEHTELNVAKGNKSIAKVNKQMERILGAVGESAEMINELSQLSSEASRMNEAIAEVAKQTNLLSFNAAIEASRAGEHGKGFTVVATEVRNLAEQAKEAADQIDATLGKMVELIERSTSNMNGEVKSQVGEGIRVSTEAAEIFKSIQESTIQIAEQIQDISAVAQEMSATTEEVSASVNELAHMSKSTAESAETTSAAAQQQMASMEEIASSSQELAGMASDLQEIVKKFKL